MNKNKKIIIMGSGNSGAGALHDYLVSRQDSFSPFNGYEFRLINDPDGLDWLYNSLYTNFNINNCALSFLRFKRYIQRLIKSNYNRKYLLYDDQVNKLTLKFIDNITEINYNGAPLFYLDKFSKLEKSIFYIKRYLLKKKTREIDLLNMRLPVKKEKFLLEAINYINNIFSLSKDYNEEKNIIINQGGSFWSPQSSTKYYGSNTYQIIVTRDPKAIFWSMKRRNSLSYPGNNLNMFVNWYKKIMENVNKEEHKKTIIIKYENFFMNFNKEKEKLCEELNININDPDNFDLDYTKKNLFKFIKNLSSEEISFINKELKDYIQC